MDKTLGLDPGQGSFKRVLKRIRTLWDESVVRGMRVGSGVWEWGQGYGSGARGMGVEEGVWEWGQGYESGVRGMGVESGV